MVFGEVIGTIGGAWTPKNVELALADPITDPIKPHVDGFGPFLFHGVIGDAAGGTVVSLKWCGWLGMAKFLQGDAHRTDGLSIEEQCTQFSFSSAGHDRLHDLAQNVDWAIVRRGFVLGRWWGCWSRAEEAISSCPGSAFWGGEVGCIAMCPQDHVACGIADDSVRMRCAIIEQLRECLHGCSCPIGLLCCQGTEGCQHG